MVRTGQTGSPLAKVAYKPDVNRTNEYIIYVNPVEFNKWKEDSSVPLVDVVDSFEVLYTTQGTQGILGRPSNQQLDNDFGTHNDSEVVAHILQAGKPESTVSATPAGSVATNIAMGSATIDTRGKGLTGLQDGHGIKKGNTGR